MDSLECYGQLKAMLHDDAVVWWASLACRGFFKGKADACSSPCFLVDIEHYRSIK